MNHLAARKTSKAMSFEEGLGRLETIAEQMERGELPLDDLLKLYEEGVKLSADLTSKLESAEGRMQEIISDADGKPKAIPTDVTRQETLLDQLD